MDRTRRDLTQPPLVPEIDPASEFELYFELEYERVYHAAYVATGSRRDAEDLAQGAFLHAWERWDRVRGMERPSLFAIRRAMNPLRMALCRRRVAWRRVLRREPTLEPFGDFGADDDIRGVLLDLPTRARAAIALVDGLDLTPGETGRALRRRTSTIRDEVAGAEGSIGERLVLAPATEGGGLGDRVQTVLDAIRQTAVPVPGVFDRHLAMRARAARKQRMTTVTVVAVVSALVAFAAGRNVRSETPPNPSEAGRASANVPPGRYRLPGMVMDASVVVPHDWRVRNSIWGSGGPGFGALSTGPVGGRVSVAVFDLILLSPFDPNTGDMRALTADGREGWLERFERSFDRRARTRLVGSTVTDPGTFNAWAPLAWVVAHAPSHGPITVSEPSIAGREGSLVSFVNSGATTELFGVSGQGAIVMRPGVTYTFWAPARGEPLAGDVMVGIAREAGATADIAGWNVVRSLSLRGY